MALQLPVQLRHLWPLQILWLSAIPATADVVLAAMLPHGDMVFAPDKVVKANKGHCTSRSCNRACQVCCKEKASRLHTAATKVGDAVRAAGVELLVLTTPHSQAQDFDTLRQHGLYKGGQTFSGGTGGTVVTIRSSELSDTVATGLISQGFTIEKSEGAPLAWAEYIPLHFLPDLPVMLIALKPFTDLNDMRKLGSALRDQLDAPGVGKVAVIISADAAHYHGGIGSPFSFGDRADDFEAEVRCWAATLDSRALELANEVNGTAGSCGLGGMQLLDGMWARDQANWRGCVLAHEVPTYFGMMVAIFQQGPHIAHVCTNGLRCGSSLEVGCRSDERTEF